jgi:transposase-like protein
MSDIECPYCDHDIEINHDDGFGYDEGVTHQYQCPSCEKSFVFTTSISFYYDAEKADCLNDGEHEWKPTTTIPRLASRMCCSTCGDERRPTEEEMETILNN